MSQNACGRLLCGLLLCASLWPAAPVLAQVEQLSVFVLHAYSQEYPWTRRQHDAFVATLTADPRFNVAFSVEYLDTKRISYDRAYGREMARHLAVRYRGYSPRLVYVTDDNALRFALEELPAMFPDAPVFFSGVNNYGIADSLDPARVTGVFERKDIEPNLDLVSLIDPEVSDIIIVGDRSETFVSIRHELESALALRGGVAAHYISESSIEALTAALAGRRERHVFLTTLGAVHDARGRLLTLGETIRAIAESGDFVVISMEDAYMFPGVLGGYVTSGLRQGQAAAELALRHLGGVSMQDLTPVRGSPNEYIFDGAELERLGLELPPGLRSLARVVNPQPGLYERHQQAIVAVIYVLGALAVLAVMATIALLVQRGRREREAARKLAVQARDMARIQASLNRAQRIARMGSWDWVLDGDQLFWSDGVYRLFGLEPGSEPPSYERFLSFIPSDDQRRVQAAVRQALDSGEVYEVEHRIVRPDGRQLMVRELGEVVQDQSGTATGMNGTVLDITSQYHAERALRDSEAMLRSVIEGFPVVLWMIDREGVFMLSEGRGLERMGLQPGEVVGSSVYDVYADYPDIIEDTRAVLTGQTVQSTRWLGEIAFEVNYSPIIDDGGRVTGAVGVAADVTERKRAEEELSQLANYDPVTGLPNRSLFSDRLQHAMVAADRDGHQVALLFMDLDNFKVINDTMGHSVGDELLRQVATRLGGCVRASDTVSRLGGDEFTIIIEDIEDTAAASRVATQLVLSAASPYELQGGNVYVTCSVGIAIFPDDGKDAQTLIMNADAAMYRAKENGRNSFEFFSSALSEGAQQRLEMTNLLRVALERGEFSLHYQPQIDITDGRVVGFEALLRWHNERLGQVSPGVFVPVLEETGLIVQVGQWVIDTACRWASSTGLDGLQIAVNISARQFRHLELAESIATTLETTGLDAELLELEITESSLVSVESHMRIMDRIKQLGVKLAIDDFGTGYSSLSYLKSLPVDRLKIDAAFVRDVADDADDAAIVRTIITLAHSLGLRVIAEGVETADQVGFLASHRCDQIQGYRVERPMPGDEALRWLQAWQADDAWQRLESEAGRNSHHRAPAPDGGPAP